MTSLFEIPDNPESFIGCYKCYKLHSGVAPTVHNGKTFRPVTEAYSHYPCHFCGQMSSRKVLRYVEGVDVE